ncbi:MAG TPA: membrane dipeptidase [Chitinophagales bacterium]
MLTIDLHCHPNLKSFNSGFPQPTKNIWEKIYHKKGEGFTQTANEISEHVLKESQANLETLAQGNVRVFQLSLYPTERGFLRMRNVPKLFVGKKRANILQEVITGYSAESIAESQKQYNYFGELQAEYKYVESQQGKSPDGKNTFVLVNNFAELQKALQQKNTLIGIVTIEGGHALGTGSPETDKLSTDDLKALLTQNIRAIKQWENPPFVINLAHHFWNHLSGHSKSFKRPINAIINQNKGINKGITEAGWHTIRLLLSRENGKRILIDTKHMSIAARKEYYAFIQNYNSINPNDTIPIIASHVGMNGFSTMTASAKFTDIMPKARRPRLFRWSINLSHEEVRIIHQSGGLIGLMMDRGMLGGLNAIENIVAIEDEKKKREAYVQLFWDNVFEIIKATGDKNGFDAISIGSDFDGTITHMEPYESAAKFPLFQQDLIEFLEKKKYKQELWYDYSPTELVEKIMYKNALNFYERFFV